MSDKGCYTCKNVRLSADEKPCITCKNSGNAEGFEDNYEPVDIPTNGERIRLMSDEDLADFLSKHYVCKPEGACPVKDCPGSECKKQTKKWLQQKGDMNV